MNEERIYTIYKHTSPSNKVYIGITSRTVERRWQGGKNYKNNAHFNNAIKKYGWDNIKHEILFTQLTKAEAEAKEIELIKHYHSDEPKHGYNIEHGGNATGKLSDATRKKISNANKGKTGWMKGKHWSDEHKAMISRKEKGKPSPMKGKHWSVEQRARTGKRIICLENKEEYYSIREAARKTGCDRASISRVLNGVYKQTGGMHFEYYRK